MQKTPIKRMRKNKKKKRERERKMKRKERIERQNKFIERRRWEDTRKEKTKEK